MTQTLHTVPAATITHTIAVIRGEITTDVTVHHARTTDARIGLIFGTALMNLYSASAAQGLLEAFAAARAAMTRVPREIAAPTTPPYEPFARTTLAIDWTRRPAYCVVPQSGPNKLGTLTIHWVDLHCGPITFQIRDQRGLKSTLDLLTRVHQTAVAVFLDGPQHAADPTADDYRWPR
ncbi:hypothetical protein GGC64_005974 [Mycobacterium sp. OAS707]|uniref:hypothetical protein n=1 Tax=Mycobacterium sp. OAS707 TaxID=2663822 RepID=UPI00178A3D1D|nr:hypothetical protein [Mycobacterium sp. OAS707]MBE1551887.1 hypothetical protein [Mycobacterium sp. OAS707]